MRSLRITDGQVDFAGTVDIALTAVEADTDDDVAGLAVVADGTVVGFMVLRRRGALGDWAASDAAALTAMRVDVSKQGRGIGSRALVALAPWVRSTWPTCTSLTLQVDVDNTVGRRAYERAGFVADGPVRPGRIGKVLTMSLPAQPAER